MKHFFILLFSFLLAQGIQAQALPYFLTVDQAAYTPLENAVSVNNGEVWDDLDIQTPLGFDFQLWGQTTSTLFWYGELTAFNIAGLPDVNVTPALIAFGADLIDRGYESNISQSQISYKTEGQPGSRIFKMEWKNAGFFEDPSGTAFTNLQVWLYEGSNDIELRFGPTQINDQEVFSGFSGPMIGFINQFYVANDGLFQNIYYLTGSVDEPAFQSITLAGIDTLYHTLNGAPDSGFVYRFSTVVDVEDPAQAAYNVQVFPTLVQDVLTIDISNSSGLSEKQAQFTVTDLTGRVLRNGRVTADRTQVNLSGLPGGMYGVHVFSPAGMVETRKIWKE
jgi:hypothetical protein